MDKNLDNFIKDIKNIMDKDYELFIKALIYIEKGIDDNDLDEIYNEYINNDDCTGLFSINDLL